MASSQAENAADNLLAELIKHQPELFQLRDCSPEGGRALGDAIIALRLKLIDMHQSQG
ncbi:hypothetical protein [Roseateles saccharophilus]|uniref:Uncharacterized protein n=1 Tax=Roseateles saccharophilus TaxID=304 RepID=A0A4R3UL98_ROSSA|nr:hypothetical protein [Roseateles saccharophilus]TCU91602.1 hypothetical protein EV671_102581 [Roseateles saccharophilus]